MMIQRVYASQFMRRAATIGAIEVAVGPAEFSAIAAHLATIPSPGIGVLPEEAGARAKDEYWWTQCAHSWADSVELGGDPRPPDTSDEIIF